MSNVPQIKATGTWEIFFYLLVVEKIVHMCGFELVIKNMLLMYIYVRLDQIL